METRTHHNLERLIASLPSIAGDWYVYPISGYIRRLRTSDLKEECPACAVMRLEDPTFDHATSPWAYTPRQNANKDDDLVNFVCAANRDRGHDPELRKRILSGLNLQESPAPTRGRLTCHQGLSERHPVMST